jgi:hypothetical protein
MIIPIFLASLHASTPADPSAAAVSARNKAAMTHFERGDFEAAYAEFAAAYDLLPDPARDRDARESVMGSLRSVLLRLNTADPDNAEPLCRLQSRLRAHLDALIAAHPDKPNLLEIRGNRQRLAAVDHHLLKFGATACTPPQAPPPEPAPAEDEAPLATQPPSPPTDPEPPQPTRPADAIPPRHLKIAGAVTLSLAGVALGAMTWRIATEASLHRTVDDVEENTTGPFTPYERDTLQALQSQARSSRLQAIGLGVTAATLSAAAIGLLVASRRAARTARWSVNPWWLTTGGGLTFHMPLGAPPRARTTSPSSGAR